LIGLTNASPLIYLGKIGALHLLPQLFDEIWTTSLVSQEVLGRDYALEKVILDEAFNTWLQVRDPRDEKLVLKLQDLQIHPGEASLIALGKEISEETASSIVIIDDRAARDVARVLGLKITGTVGILLRAVNANIIVTDQCRMLLKSLNENTNFRMGVDIFSKILSTLDKIDYETK
jgi:hypothetical protein